MKKMNEMLSKLEFYPSQQPYTGCQGRQNVLTGDCGAGDGRILNPRLKNFVLGDCEEWSIN